MLEISVRRSWVSDIVPTISREANESNNSIDFKFVRFFEMRMLGHCDTLLRQ